MSIIYQNGLGDTQGDALATCRPLYSSGNVWYVNSAGGVDATTPAGQNREKPLATLAQAVTNAASGDIIELMSGHAETITSGVSVSKQLTIVGGGSLNGQPTVRLTPNTTGNLLICGATNCQLRNIWFPSNLQASTVARVAVVAQNFRMHGCYFECGANDQAAGLSLDNTTAAARISNTTFISTATSATAQPESGLKTTVAITDLELDGVVFSGGAFGFSNYRAFDGSAFAITRLYAINISQLLGADVKLHASTTGRWNTQTCTGGARLDW